MFTAEELTAVRLSLGVALTAVVVSLPLGMAVAWLLARRRFVGKTAIETIINLPLVLPPVVTGYLLLVTFGRRGFVGRWLDQWFGWQFVFNWKGAALASAVMAFPLMVRSMRLAFSAVDPRLEQAARTLGAGPWDTFLHVTLPLARNGVIAGAVLAFARGLGEFGATIMIAGNIPGETRTVPLEIYNLLESPGGADQAWRLVAASIVIAAGAMAIGEYLERRGRSDLSMA
jgi:molybdate transport system permease protein